MHWIEQLLGSSPDGGNGSLETAIFVFSAFLVLVATGFGSRVLVRRSRGRR